jgi:hypothetical protein
MVKVTVRRGRRRRRQLLDELQGKERIRENERGSTRSHYVGNSLWKRLWTAVRQTAELINDSRFSKTQNVVKEAILMPSLFSGGE